MEVSQPDVFTMVPSYNHGTFIGRCLRSIIDQTVSPRKLLVIDDGSTDGSPEVIAKVLNDCPFPSELIVRENRGLCATLNQALTLTDHKYFAYIGADDIWLPEFLDQRFRVMEERSDAVLAYGHAYIIDSDDKVIDSTADYTDSWADYPDGNARAMLLKGISPISSTIFYRRSILNRVSWNERSRLEDYEMYIQLMNLGDFAFDPQVLSAWRDHSKNTSKDTQMMLREVIATQDRNIDTLGVSREELDRLQAKTKFTFAREMLQHGDKSAAMQLAKENWQGAQSKGELLKFALRMAVPMFVVGFKRSRRAKKALEALRS